MINDMGIQVMEEAPDADDLPLAENTTSTDEDAEEAAAQVLSSAESEIGRTTDPVRMYMREMGTAELLTRKAKSTSLNVSKHDQPVHALRCRIPGSHYLLLEQYDRVEAEEARLSDLITGFVDPERGRRDGADRNLTSVLELSRDLDDDEDEDEEDGDAFTQPMTTTALTLNWHAKNSLLNCARNTSLRATPSAKGRSHAAAQEEILEAV